jgi:hypothetical protein
LHAAHLLDPALLLFLELFSVLLLALNDERPGVMAGSIGVMFEEEPMWVLLELEPL